MRVTGKHVYQSSQVGVPVSPIIRYEGVSFNYPIRRPFRLIYWNAASSQMAVMSHYGMTVSRWPFN